MFLVNWFEDIGSNVIRWARLYGARRHGARARRQSVAIGVSLAGHAVRATMQDRGQCREQVSRPPLVAIPLTEYRQTVYTFQMIESFRDKDTQTLFEGKRVKRFANMEAIAQRKLQQLDSASTLEFLRSPPGNRLEALAGDRAGQHSIRINDQFRLCFIWKDGDATDVEIVDYH